MTPRDQVLKMQRIILRQLKATVHRLEGSETPEFSRYYQAYKKEFKGYQRISNKSELLRSIRRAHIVFGADFHAFAQSQRTHLRILRELVKLDRPVVLAFEAVDSAHQKNLDLYLSGKLTDQSFLKKIKYFNSWGFPWENYKILFDFAKSNKLLGFGINMRGRESDLSFRDVHSARQIAKLRRTFPKSLIYVIYGDLHLARSHLPRLTRKFLGKNDQAQFLTIFQNSESLYWSLAKRKLEEKVDVLKLRSDAYCVVNSPPWLKWQAYLQFLENHIDSDSLESNEQHDQSDFIFNFIAIIKKLWNVEGSFIDFHVFGRGDMKMAAHMGQVLNKRELNWAEKLINMDRSFFVPKANILYLANSDVNHAASLVGQYVHAKLRRERRFLWQFPQDFVPSIWVEAIGFFASKLVNSRRKFNAIRDLPSSHQVTLLVLEQRLREQVALKTRGKLKKVRSSRPRRPLDYYEASKILGALLGNRMYQAFIGEDLDFSVLYRWLRHPVDATTGFMEFYMSVLSELPSAMEPEQSKYERL